MNDIEKSKFGVMVYQHENKGYNVGDYIQSLAGEQYLPRVDKYINREGLSEYNDGPVNMIMNGWYLSNPKNWPPSPDINPLYVSFHLNSSAKEGVLSDEGVKYLKKHQPIGCRDLHTLRLLQDKGIEAFLSGCLTTTLDVKYKSTERTDKIYFADPLFNVPSLRNVTRTAKSFIKNTLNGNVAKIGKWDKVMNQIFTKSMMEKAEWVTHLFPNTHTEEERFQNAKDTLKKFATAKLVITSRIHCALPCLALGTPVIFINYGFDDITDKCRFEGIVSLFNTIEIDSKNQVAANFELPKEGKISEDFQIENPKDYLQFADKLKERCREFVKEAQSEMA